MRTLRTKRLRVAVVALALAATLTAAACGDDEGKQDDTAATSLSRKDIHIEFAFVGVPGDPYYTVIKNGAAQAEKDMGVEVEYKETSQYDFQEQVRLIKAAIARKPDGLVVSEESPEVLDGPVKDAVDAGIPVIIAAAGETPSRRQAPSASWVRTSSRWASRPASSSRRRASSGLLA